MSTRRRRAIIGILGGADPGLPAKILEEAEEAGRWIARARAVLLCGGRTGVMEAAARGAKSLACGETMAILPGRDPDGANPYMDLVVATGMGNGRNIINILSSDAVIAFPGGAGTFSEIALALKCGIPVVALPSWNLDVARDALSLVTLEPCFHKAASAREAVLQALHLARHRPEAAETTLAEITELLMKRARAWTRGDREESLACLAPSEDLALILEERLLRGNREQVAGGFDELRGRYPSIELDPGGLDLLFMPGLCVQAVYRYVARRGEEKPEYLMCTSILVHTGGGYKILSDRIGP